jgi:hypothetical protein
MNDPTLADAVREAMADTMGRQSGQNRRLRVLIAERDSEIARLNTRIADNLRIYAPWRKEADDLLAKSARQEQTILGLGAEIAALCKVAEAARRFKDVQSNPRPEAIWRAGEDLFDALAAYDKSKEAQK